MKFLAVPFLFLLSVPFAAQTTLSTQTSTNTSACSTSASHCATSFTGMYDSASGVYNAAPQHIGLGDLHSLEYPGSNTDIYAHFMPWFCMQPGSTATGTGTNCNSHVQVGYNSNDPATVASQMSDMKNRGISGPIIDWYGPTAVVEESTTQVVKNDLEGRCSGGSCPMTFALNEDQGSITHFCFLDGAGADQTSCILNVLESDLDYMNTNYFPSPAYLRVDPSTMKHSAVGRPIVFFFICETCFTNPSPNWSYIWNQLRSHVLSYSTGDPIMWFIFRNSGAFTHTQSDGAFAWINHYGSNDPYGLAYLDNFYDTSLKYPTLQPWGAAWKGFDNTNAAWKPGVSITSQQCGSTWLRTLSEMTHNGDYSSTHQLPFLQLTTWNDYDEGSEIETGIDNCLSLSASSDGISLSWTPSFSASSGSENTVDHYNVYGSVDGATLTQLATVASGVHSVPLSSLDLSSGKQNLYVEAVGKPSIANHFSGAVPYSPGVAINSLTPNSGSTAGGVTVTIAGRNFVPGVQVTFGGVAATVTAASTTSISVLTPAHSAGAVNVTVSNPDGGTSTLASAFTYVAPANFAISISPSSKTVSRGATAAYTVSVSPLNGFTGRVSFAVAGLPSGATASFSPSTVTTTGSTKLSIGTKLSARGTFSLTISGTSGTLTNRVSATLTVK
jgi:hypothetical protein